MERSKTLSETDKDLTCAETTRCPSELYSHYFLNVNATVKGVKLGGMDLGPGHVPYMPIKASKLSGNLFEQVKRNARNAEVVCILPWEQHSQLPIILWSSAFA